jgi:hypothetical protein
MGSGGGSCRRAGGIPLGSDPRLPGGWYLAIAYYSASSAGVPVKVNL